MPRLLASLLLTVAMPLAAETPHVEIVGHRGASFEAPENTLASVNLAWEQGADAAEIDVWLTRDGLAVACHDETTKRTAGLDRRVADQSLAELQTLDAGSWKDSQFHGERLPELGEVLATIPDGKRLFVEIKCGPEVLPAISKAFENMKTAPASAVIIGFDYDTMAAAKRAFPDRAVYWVVSPKPDETGSFRPTVEELIGKARAANLDGLDLKAAAVDESMMTAAGVVMAVHDAGLALHVWTVDDPELARRLAAAGVDGITTNRPGFLRERLGKVSE